MSHYLQAIRALGEPTRFRLARVLHHAGTELCICELVDILRRPEYAVSRAARGLRAAGLVAERRRGKLVYYRSAEDALAERLSGIITDLPQDDELVRYDLDRLRWRVDIREEGRCIITYRGAVGARPPRPRVLLVCRGDRTRAQIARHYLRRYAGDLLDSQSAGGPPRPLPPEVSAAFAEDGVDLSQERSAELLELYRSGLTFDYLLVLGEEADGEGVPRFPEPIERSRLSLGDPACLPGSPAERAERARRLREEIRLGVHAFVDRIRSKGGEQPETGAKELPKGE